MKEEFEGTWFTETVPGQMIVVAVMFGFLVSMAYLLEWSEKKQQERQEVKQEVRY